jgi:hypothetical protein
MKYFPWWVYLSLSLILVAAQLFPSLPWWVRLIDGLAAVWNGVFAGVCVTLEDR